jgi:hypothetical protein
MKAAWAALASALACAPSAHAAGGHHAVDDASILEPGQCQVESWVDRENGGNRSTLHAGTACRVAGVELGLDVDRSHLAAMERLTMIGAQLKWARAWSKGSSFGLLVSSAWEHPAARHAGTTVVVPLTWQPGENVAVHVNVGREFRHRARDGHRAGAEVEWAPLPAWSVIAERFTEDGTPFARAGARWTLTPAISVDLSRAQPLGGRGPAWWTFGVTWVFETAR